MPEAHKRPKLTSNTEFKRKSTEFQEAPGETEADMVRDAFLRGAGANPARQAVALSQSDSATRAQVVNRLQTEHGNRYVQGLVAAARRVPRSVQRYAVGLPASADCAAVLDWMNNNNPYAPNWAKTHVRFNWSGGFNITGTAPDFRLRVSRPSVSKSVRVDMPVWRSSDSALQAAWSSMTTTLRAHEREHENIATTWQTTLRDRLAALDIPVTAASRDEVNAQANTLINDEWNVWINDHQSAQNAIDPYTAPLNCPSPPSAGGAGSGSTGH